MDIASQDITQVAAYKLLIGSIVPRPIAWVTSLSSSGIVNLAPFSAFTYLSSDPPLVGFSIGLRGGLAKDTARNVQTTKEFVVNIASSRHLNEVHESAVDFEPNVSEVDRLGLSTIPSHRVAAPRLAHVGISLECVLYDVIDFGREPSKLIVGEVLMFHVADELVKDGKVDSKLLDPIARLGGPIYAPIGNLVHLRPLPLGPKE